MPALPGCRRGGWRGHVCSGGLRREDEYKADRSFRCAMMVKSRRYRLHGSQEVLNQLLPFARQHALRVKLHALDCHFPMP